MSKTIESPVKRWPGTVTLSEPLSLPQKGAWEDAQGVASAAHVRGGMAFSWMAHILPGILACVEKWELGGDWPKYPSVTNVPCAQKDTDELAELILWLTKEIQILFFDATDIPNA
jgi:hypothetical protein